MKNNWYFQQHVSNYPLIRFVATACSLTSMFQPQNSKNNNCSLHMLNTRLFQKSAFEYYNQATGYFPKEGIYLYGLLNGHATFLENPIKSVVFLGDTHINDEGHPINNMQASQYTYKYWGNPFFHGYLTGTLTSFVYSKGKDDFFSATNLSKKLNDLDPKPQIKQEPYYITVRYNPNKDKGTGNMAYWVSVSDATKNNWEPMSDPDTQISGYPFWLMLWGWEDYTKKLGKLHNLDDNYMLVLRSPSAFSEGIPAYVPLNESFIEGEGPYGKPASEISPTDYGHWHPKWKFQREAINSLIMTGPGTCKAEQTSSIQAYMKYNFLFKWGGNPATMETVYDPQTQPIYPNPSEELLRHEIDDPKSSITQMLYRWDTRRDYITQSAKERITRDSFDDIFMFTDGTTTSTDIPLPKKAKTQEKTTSEKEEETLLLQLQQLQQYNIQLQQRFNKLKTSLLQL